MASTTRKKTTTKQGRSGSRTAKGRQPQKRPIRREVGGVVLLVLALCVLVSYCGVQAILIDLLAELLKGLFGAATDFYTKDVCLGGVRCCICMFEGLSSIERLWVMMLDILSHADTPLPQNDAEARRARSARSALSDCSQCLVRRRQHDRCL